MKKILAFILAMIMMLSFAACSNEPAENEGENNSSSEEETVTVGSALEILENTWENTDLPKDMFTGGDGENYVNGAPAATSNMDYIIGALLVPNDAYSEIVEAASLMHMNANTFTCGAFKVADAAAFAETMHNSVASAQWMCGFPDKMVIATFGNEYVLVVFGKNDSVNPFEAGLATAYPEANIVYNEAITG